MHYRCKLEESSKINGFESFQSLLFPVIIVHLLKLLLLVLASQGGNFFIAHVYLLLIDYFSWLLV